MTKRRWLVVVLVILAALATTAVVLSLIPYSTDAVDYGGVTSIR